MTNLNDIPQSTTPSTLAAVAATATSPDAKLAMPTLRTAIKKPKIHPKQPHLDALIHAKIVTHLVHLDAGPDPIYALSQMQDMPEVKFAAVFDDGLIAIGCPGTLPTELAPLANVAVPTAPSDPPQPVPVHRIEQVSRKLETLVEAMVPDEVILNDQLGRSILDRLTALETQITRQPQKADDTAVNDLRADVSVLQDRVLAISDPTPALEALHAKISDVNRQPDTITGEKLEHLYTGFQAMTERVDATLVEIEQAQTGSASRDAGLQDAIIEKLSDQIGRLDRNIEKLAAAAPTQSLDMERAMKTFTRDVKTSLKEQPHVDQLSDKVEQIGSAQRTAFARIETAVTKAVSGLEPALDHLNARAADTENLITSWHKDFSTLSQNTKSIADQTEQLPSVFVALQNDIAALAEKPAPILDLTAQQEGFDRFSTNLSSTLKEIEEIAQKTEATTSKVAAQSDETIATLQTLPSLISTTIRHEIDLKPIEQSIAEVQTALSELPNDMNLSTLAKGLATLSDQIVPMGEAQAAEFDGLQSAIKLILSQLKHLGDDITGLQANAPDLVPLKELIETVHEQMIDLTQEQTGELQVLRDKLSRLAQHLGVAQDLKAPLIPASQLAPETSLNTLRMEFADLISKKMKENDAPQSAAQA